MNRDLFLAILALDSYNRGYDVRLEGPSDDLGQQLGLAKVLSNSDSLLDDEGNQTAEPAGFYAVAYEWNGETVISYRGTDRFAQDAINGYAIGGGFTGFIAPQGELATQFYHDVTNQSAYSPNVLGNVVLTGHSLGGGLAGLVSVASGAEAFIFDHMPFVDAAFDAAISSATEPESELFARILQLLETAALDGLGEFGGLAGNLLELARIGDSSPEAFAAAGVRYPTTSQIRAISVEGELLAGIRSGEVQTVIAALGAFIEYNPNSGDGNSGDGILN